MKKHPLFTPHGKTGHQKAMEEQTLLKVKLPGTSFVGRNMRHVLESLVNQITTEHLNRKIKRFKVDAVSREIQIHFEEERRI